jgi:hypothetical protein
MGPAQSAKESCLELITPNDKSFVVSRTFSREVGGKVVPMTLTVIRLIDNTPCSINQEHFIKYPFGQVLHAFVFLDLQG